MTFHETSRLRTAAVCVGCPHKQLMGLGQEGGCAVDGLRAICCTSQTKVTRLNVILVSAHQSRPLALPKCYAYCMCLFSRETMTK